MASPAQFTWPASGEVQAPTAGVTDYAGWDVKELGVDRGNAGPGGSDRGENTCGAIYIECRRNYGQPSDVGGERP